MLTKSTVEAEWLKFRPLFTTQVPGRPALYPQLWYKFEVEWHAGPCSKGYYQASKPIFHFDLGRRTPLDHLRLLMAHEVAHALCPIRLSPSGRRIIHGTDFYSTWGRVMDDIYELDVTVAELKYAVRRINRGGEIRLGSVS